jgi:hypothetical protein
MKSGLVMILFLLFLFGKICPSQSNTPTYSETKIYSKFSDRKDYFGYSVAIYDDWVVAGSYSSSLFQLDSGAAFSFQKNASSNVTRWVEKGTLSGSDIKPHDYFGGSIAIWKSTVVVGAYLDENVGAKTGFAYIFIQSDGVWKEQQKLLSLGGNQAADYFGQCVDIHEDVIIVGAYRQQFRGYYRGAAYIFRRQSYEQTWTLTATLRPNDLTENRNNMMFGYCVQVLNTTAVVGAYGDNFQGANTGAVYIFQFKYFDETNAIGEWVQTHKLIPRDARQQSNFGISIALSREYVQKNSGYFLSIVVGANLGRGNTAGTGAAYLFRSKVISTSSFESPQWTQQSKLYAPDGSGEELFGTSVAIDGSLIAIGAPDDSSKGTDSGSVYVFRRVTTSATIGSGSISHTVKWSYLRKIVGNDTRPYDNFGSSVAIFDETIAIGSVHTDGSVTSTGAVYVIVEGEEPLPYIKKTSLLKTEKDQFVFILTLFPVLLVLLPVCVMSSVVYFNNNYSTFASAISRGMKGSEVALQEYASLHGSSSHLGSSTGGGSSDIGRDIGPNLLGVSHTPLCCPSSESFVENRATTEVCWLGRGLSSRKS